MRRIQSPHARPTRVIKIATITEIVMSTQNWREVSSV
jgi:hypothetical protein